MAKLVVAAQHLQCRGHAQRKACYREVENDPSQRLASEKLNHEWVWVIPSVKVRDGVDEDEVGEREAHRDDSVVDRDGRKQRASLDDGDVDDGEQQRRNVSSDHVFGKPANVLIPIPAHSLEVWPIPHKHEEQNTNNAPQGTSKSGGGVCEEQNAPCTGAKPFGLFR
eukprot:CAMPEP_0198715990 /NCGR_PEP_ID=MMETSP1471-20131121/35153_1 /TAXON_ID=41880 /ORGANISM="Pycnococcus provasolii, Strain RCC733" /LENGTH=166 /DNA_ID=CAMNT_0044476477 /DNA_START=57 /DNA_END=558 /DNA_ORIENTATION=+